VASKFSIQVEKNYCRAAGTRTHALLELVVRKAAADVEAQAKVLAPVDTGALRNSIQAENTGPLAAEVTVGVAYGLEREIGSLNRPAKPYLGPALESVRPAFAAAVRAAVRQGTGG
jgi:hypothetical protein